MVLAFVLKAAGTRLIVVIVDHGFFHGPFESAAHAHAAHPVASSAVAKAMQDGLHAFKSQGTRRHSRGGLHGTAQKAGLAGLDRHVLLLGRILRLRRPVLVLGLGRRILLNRLIWRRRGRPRLRVFVAQQTAKEAGGVRRLLAGLLQLLLELRNLGFGLVESDVLHQHRLGKNVQRIGIGAEFVAEQILSVGIFLLQLCLVDLLRQGRQEFLFLGSHGIYSSGSANLPAWAASQD